MARDAISKDELKRDPFQEWMFHAIDYVHKRRRRFIAGGVALVAVVGTAGGLVLNQRMTARAMADAFNEVEGIFHDRELPKAERIGKSRVGLKAYLLDYRDSALAPYAWMHLAALAIEDQDPAEAEKAYRAVIDNSGASSSLVVIAQIALAKLREDSGQLAESSEIYRSIPPDRYGDLAALSLGRIALEEHNVEEARAQLEIVSQQYPDSSLAAQAQQALFYLR